MSEINYLTATHNTYRAMKAKEKEIFHLQLVARKNRVDFLKTVERFLEIDNEFREENFHGEIWDEKESNERSKEIRKLTKKIKKLTDKESKVKKFVKTVKAGKLEEVKIFIGKKNHIVSAMTDFKELLPKFKIKKSRFV